MQCLSMFVNVWQIFTKTEEKEGMKNRQQHYPLCHGTYYTAGSQTPHESCSKPVFQRIHLSHSLCSFNVFLSSFLCVEIHMGASLGDSVAMVASCILFSPGWHNALARMRKSWKKQSGEWKLQLFFFAISSVIVHYNWSHFPPRLES